MNSTTVTTATVRLTTSPQPRSSTPSLFITATPLTNLTVTPPTVTTLISLTSLPTTPLTSLIVAPLTTPTAPLPTTLSPPPQVDILLPAAGVVAIVIAVFLLIVIGLLLTRKAIMARGVMCPECPRMCVQCDCCPDSCWECCRGLNEKLDCQTPDCNAWFDRVCPSKQAVSVFCGQLLSCYHCFLCAEACRNVRLCPDCSAVECPDCECFHCCHCAIKVPECQTISCLCFECGLPQTA